jgi:hypothetical protein
MKALLTFAGQTAGEGSGDMSHRSRSNRSRSKSKSKSRSRSKSVWDRPVGPNHYLCGSTERSTTFSHNKLTGCW